MSGWSLDNPVFVSFAFYSGVLAAKVLLMAPMTGYYRMTKKVFANDEDAKAFGAKEAKTGDADVERVRRAHQNDLENIPVFWMLGLLYVQTSPSALVATSLFRAFSISRILHTVLYLSGSGKRGMAFLVGLGINVFLAGSVIYSFYNY